MTDHLDRLKDIGIRSSEFVTRADTAMHSAIAGYAPLHHALSHLAEQLCSKYALTAEIQGGALVLYPLGTRAKQPPCITISRAASQQASPSSAACYRSAFSLIQVFEAGADDSAELEGAGEAPTHRIETKGRVLLV